MRYAVWTLCSLLPWLFLGCQAGEPPASTRLFADIYVRYLEPDRSIRAEVSFLKGDSLKNARPVSFANGVFFLDMPMEGRNLPDDLIRYQADARIPYPEKMKLTFRPDEGGQYELEFGMDALGPFQLTGPASKTKGLDLTAPGSRLSQEENLVLLFSDPNDKAYTLILQGPTDGIRHVFHPRQMNDLAYGPQQLFLVKKRMFGLQQDGLDANITLEYYSRTKEIEVVE